jgi:plasmid stability protein
MTPWVHNIPVADVKVRKVPDWVVESFRSRATALGHSLEEELRSLLTEIAHARRQEFIAEAGAFRKTLHKRYGQLSDSTRGIAADRERRG